MTRSTVRGVNVAADGTRHAANPMMAGKAAALMPPAYGIALADGAPELAAPDGSPEEPRLASSPPAGQLRIGAADDPAERAADALAARVLAIPAALPAPATIDAAPMLRRKCDVCAEEERLQRFAAGDAVGGGAAPASVRAVLAAPGQPLDGASRVFFEPRFGLDLSGVRVHSNAAAAASARDVGALAYTVGRHIVFGEGRHAPQSDAGRRLLAHELAHVAQQENDASSVIRRDDGEGSASPACPPPPPRIIDGAGQNVEASDPGPETIIYRYWGRSREGDTTQTFLERTTRAWIRWRFGARPADDQARALQVALGLRRIHVSVTPVPGCYYFIAVSRSALRQIVSASRENVRPREPAPAAPGASIASPQEVGTIPAPPSGATRPEPAPSAPGGTPGPQPEEARAPSETERAFEGEAERLHPDWAVLAGNEPLARRYLLHMQHFAGLALTPEIRALASGGFAEDELRILIGTNRRLRFMTDRYTQAFAEFRAAGGTEVEAFAPLIELILEQLNWGNPTAARNLLQIGRGGVPFPAESDILGICHRRSRWLLYDASGAPLRSIAGQMFRDEGYVAARPPEFGLNIAAIEDPAIRGMLNMLRQQVGDPNRMVIRAAEVYFRNTERVKAKVLQGLTAEVIRKFEEALPLFVLFLAGQALSTLLLRSPNPVLLAIGAALRGLLTAAGYVLQIDFAAGALERLFAAARPLSRVREEEDGSLTELSQTYLEQAAVPLRTMVADIALMAGLHGFGRLLGAIRGRGPRAEIRCTRCDITPQPGEPTTPARGRTVREMVTEARTRPAEEALTQLEGVREPRAASAQGLSGRLASLEARISAVRQARTRAWREGELASQRRDARETTRLAEEVQRLDGQLRNLEAQRATMERELGQRRSELSELDREIARQRLILDPRPGRQLPCFLAGTPVLTPDGPRAIETLAAGDAVLAYDLIGQTVTTRRVLTAVRGEAVETVAITAGGAIIEATYRHRFLADGQWTEAAALAPAQRLLAAAGADITVDRVERRGHAPVPTFNLSVETDANYFVGPGVLVHNDGTPTTYSFGEHIIYEGVYVGYEGQNPAERARLIEAFRNKIYVGQTNDLATRQSRHVSEAIAELSRPNLSPAERQFFEFKRGMRLRPRITGLTGDQATFMEQRNFEIEVTVRGRENVMNRIEIATPERMRALEAQIRADPRVRAAGLC